MGQKGGVCEWPARGSNPQPRALTGCKSGEVYCVWREKKRNPCGQEAVVSLVRSRGVLARDGSRFWLLRCRPGPLLCAFLESTRWPCAACAEATWVAPWLCKSWWVELRGRGCCLVALWVYGWSSDSRFRSSDLWVMSPTRYRCAKSLCVCCVCGVRAGGES